MTRDRRRIGLLAQWRWWRRCAPDYRVYLLRQKRRVIGYGLITREGWLTGAVLPAWRGKGYGRYLFEELIVRCPVSPRLEVLATNERAQRLYLSLGFQKTAEEKGVLTMQLPRSRP